MLKFEKECYVIPNLVDTKEFTNNKKRKVGKTFNLVSVCALREGKKIENIFKALDILIKKGRKSVHLDVIGDGFFEDYYKEECHKLNLEEYVTFLGRKNKKEIGKILLNEHALVISSELESFAIPGIEALASGLPVISTKCLGPEEYINDKCGKLCENNNVQSLANAIEYVQDNYETYNPDYLKEVADKFSAKQVISSVEKIYNDILKKYND